VEGKEFSLDPRFAKVSELLNELLNNKDGDEVILLIHFKLGNLIIT
jgi:hypothetical protein